MIEIKNRFQGIIGQEKAKKKLSFYLDNYDSTRILPHILFIAPKGCGKTMMAKAVGKNLTLEESPDRPLEENASDKKPLKRFLEINCSSIKSTSEFINGFLSEHVVNKEVTILFDEASELPKSVTMFLLSALNPNSSNFNSVSHNGITLDFDFRKQTFMFATTEAHRLFHALVDRCERIDIEEYSLDNLGEIVRLNLNREGLSIEDDTLKNVSTVVRGNARASQKMANNIRNYLVRAKKTCFDSGDWEEVKRVLSIVPLGLNDIELQIMRALYQRRDTSLTNLSAKIGLTAECIRKDFEMYLQKQDLMCISTGGRSLTMKGQRYLEDLKT